MLPLRFTPIPPWAVSVYVARFGGGADIALTTRDLRTGMAFESVKKGTLGPGEVDRVMVSLRGQWSANSSTFQNDYLHPAYYNAAFSHMVSHPFFKPVCP